MEEFLAPLSRHINGLKSGNKATTRRALKAISKALFPPSPSADPSVAVEAYTTTLAPPILALADGPSEAARTAVHELVMSLLGAVQSVDEETARSALETTFALLLPIYARRYTLPYTSAASSGPVPRGGYPCLEPAEEVRAEVALLLENAIPLLASFDLLPLFGDDILDLILPLLADAFHEVLYSAANALVAMAGHARETVKMRTSQSFYNAALALLEHQHSRIRVSALHALEALILTSDTGVDVDLIKDLAPSLSTAVLDRSPKVRTAALSMIGSWLVSLTDRHVYLRYLLTPLLTGLTDDIPDVNAHTLALIEAIAADATANEEETLAELAAFGDDVVIDPSFIPPAFAGSRPSLAARRTVGRKVHDLLPHILKDMTDWTVKKRHVAVRLVSVLTVFAEAGIVSFVPDILTSFLDVAVDEEPQVRASFRDAATLLGAAVEPGPLVAPLLDISVDALGSRSLLARSSALHTLAFCLQGMSPESLASAAFPGDPTRPLVDVLLSGLSDNSSFDVQDEHLHVGLTAVASTLIGSALTDQALDSASYALLKLLLTQLAWSSSPTLTSSTQDALATLQSRLNIASTSELYAQHAQSLLTDLGRATSRWMPTSIPLATTRLLISNLSPAGLAPVLLGPEPVLATILENLHSGAPTTAHTAALSALATGLAQNRDQHPMEHEFGPALAQWATDYLVPLLTWRAGLEKAEERGAALSVLFALATTGLWDNDGSALPVWTSLVPSLESLLDDRIPESRITTLQLADALLQACLASADDPNASDALSESMLASLGPLSGRLNDAEDTVRIAATLPLRTLVSHPVDAWSAEDRASLLSTLFIHLDDPSSDVRSSVASTIAALKPSVSPDVYTSSHASATSASHNAASELQQLGPE